MAHKNSSDMAVESYFIDETTVNNTVNSNVVCQLKCSSFNFGRQ